MRIGDRVRVVGRDDGLEGERGEVVRQPDGFKRWGVRFDRGVPRRRPWSSAMRDQVQWVPGDQLVLDEKGGEP